MLVPKQEFKNTVISVRVGNATIQVKAEDITERHIEAYKNHVDLTYFVESFEITEEPREELLDLQEKPQPKKRRTRKK